MMQLIEKEGFFHITNAGEVLKTRAGHILRVPHRALGESIIAQGDLGLRFHLSLAESALDVPRAAICAKLLTYADSETLCYRAESPHELVARQAVLWDEWLAWCAQNYRLQFEPVMGLMPRAPSSRLHERVRDIMMGFEAYRSVGILGAVQVTGSVVLGLALADDAIGAEAAYQAAHLEALYQMEQWGADEEALAHAARIRLEIKSLISYFKAILGD